MAPTQKKKTTALLTLVVNGQSHEVAAPHHHTLCEVLRERLRLTGTKQGCDKGDCGACTVLVGGQAVLSCLTLACAVDGPVTTIEGLAQRGQLDPVQDAFDKCGALQCGFCQPGMMLSARALLDDNPAPTIHEIRSALSGNLCRCTGYTKILEAVLLAAANGQDVDQAYNEMRSSKTAVDAFPDVPAGGGLLVMGQEKTR